MVDQLPTELRERFDVTQRVAQGRTGILYRASQRSTGQGGLLKMLHPELVASASDRLRVTTDLKRQGAIASPRLAIPSLWGELPETVWFFRRWVEGHPLDRFLHSQGVPEHAAVRSLIAQVAQGLDALHRAGLVHRDLKSSHIIGDHRGEVVVIDAGIAAPAATQPELQVRGTAEYLAPEIIRGELASARSDLYALGCVLFELLAGHLPFVSTDETSVLDAQLHQPPPPLPATAPEEARSLAARLLNKDPEGRPMSAAEVVQVLSQGWSAGPSASDDFNQADDATVQLDIEDLMASSEFAEGRAASLQPSDADDFEDLRTRVAPIASEENFDEQITQVAVPDAEEFEDLRTLAAEPKDSSWEDAPTRLYDVDHPESTSMVTEPAPGRTEPAPGPTEPAPPAVDVLEDPQAEPTPVPQRSPHSWVTLTLLLILGATAAFFFFPFDRSLVGPQPIDPFQVIPIPRPTLKSAKPAPVVATPVDPPAAPEAVPDAEADVTEEQAAEEEDSPPNEESSAKPPATNRRPRAPRAPTKVPTAPAEAPAAAEPFVLARDEARTAYAAGLWAKAEEAYLRASELNPKNAGVLAGLGTTRLRQRNAKGAVAAFEEAVVLDPDNANFWAALARAYRNAGDGRSARSAYERALELDPDNAFARAALGLPASEKTP